MKKLIALTLIIVMCFSLTVFVSAEDTQPSATLIYSDIAESTDIPNNTIHLGQPVIQTDGFVPISPASTSIPTQYWNLANSNYPATIDYVAISWLYTNCYFKTNANGQIFVQYTIYSSTGRSTPMKVGIYDLTTSTLSIVWTSAGATLAGITEGIYISNLNTTHNYAICFTTGIPDGVFGSAIISDHQL